MKVLKCPKNDKLIILDKCFHCENLIQIRNFTANVNEPNEIECSVNWVKYINRVYEPTDNAVINL